MDDETPSKPEPRLFGLLFHQLVAICLSLIAGTQLYARVDSIPVLGFNILPYLCLFLIALGPAYCFVPRNQWASWLEHLKPTRRE